MSSKTSVLATSCVLSMFVTLQAQVLDHQSLLEAQSFWDNRDWDWYRANIPFFDSPDPQLNTTYYYRWEVVTKHLTYGSPSSGYTFTEFIDRPFWSGTHGAISCPAGHQLYEVRWLKDPVFARDYARYWMRTPGAQPRNYSTWLADATWAVHQVHPDQPFLLDLLPDLEKNHRGWEERHHVDAVGLFWQTGHDDGMEININSRQTADTLRGAPGYRPTLNSYLYADALALARMARLAGKEEAAAAHEAQARIVKARLQELLWDPRRQFFLQVYQRDEERDGHRIKAMTRTHESGRFAGSDFGRELIGYVPWQFNLPDPGYEVAWKKLIDPEAFQAPFGPRTVERQDPMFELSKWCCWWSGQSWPYATTQTLVALANLLNNYQQDHVTRADYVKLLQTYARTHQKDGRPYIAEAAHPETGSWEGHDSYNHSEHYFHSGFTDLVITGLVGLRPRDDDLVEVNPLAPATWDYFALDDVPYRGHRLAVVWDRLGTRYGRGQGLHVLVDGKPLVSSQRLERVSARLPAAAAPGAAPSGVATRRTVNFAVQNDGRYFPQAFASSTSSDTSLAALHDGNYWYHPKPPNRWTTGPTTAAATTVGIDLGLPRPIHTIKLYVLGDEEGITVPDRIAIELWQRDAWVPANILEVRPPAPTARRANVFRLQETTTDRIRVTFTHPAGAVIGLSELEAWGDAELPVLPAPPPPGNLAVNPSGQGFPRLTASHTSRFDRVEQANDGLIFYSPSPHNRWTAFESPNASDWLELDFGAPRMVSRVELCFYDDRGGVQAPADYTLEQWSNERWQAVAAAVKSPRTPTGRMRNTVRFEAVQTQKLRVVFTHRDKSRVGLTEMEAWKE